MVPVIDLLYNGIAIPLLRLWLAIGSLWNNKLAQRRSDRAADARAENDLVAASPCLWVHAASMGEFEQAIPVITELRSRIPGITVLATFTSPSGYRHVQRAGYADIVRYLDADTRAAAQRFMVTYKPVAAVFVRYDLWRQHVLEAYRRFVPVHVIDATFPSAASWWALRAWIADTYAHCTSVTAMTDDDAQQFSTLLGTHVTSLPDTRYDRIMQRIENPDPRILSLQRTDVITLVIGSSWSADEDLFLAALPHLERHSIRLIIVPHEPTPQHVDALAHRISARLLSKITDPRSVHHIIVDSVGSLLSLYAVADAAYVGGGFGAGVHSLAEPAGHGLALACGPRIDRSRDARVLLHEQALTVITSEAELLQWIDDVVASNGRRTVYGERSRAAIERRTGSSAILAARIASSIQATVG